MDLPSSTETEKALIACVLNSPETVVRDMASRYEEPSKLFHDLKLQAVFNAVSVMLDEGKDVDIVSLPERMQAGGETKLDRSEFMDLWQLMDSPLNWPTHAGVLMEHRIRRELIRHAFEVSTAAGNLQAPPQEAIESAHNGAAKIAAIASNKEKSLGDFLQESIDDLESAFRNKGNFIGAPTGFTKLDSITRGFRKGQMVVIAARPAMGKTSLAMTMAINGAERGAPCVFFSLEMLGKDLTTRAICGLSGVPMDKAESGDLNRVEFEKITKAQIRFRKLPLNIVESSGMTMAQIFAKTAQLVATNGVRVVYVDYLQLIKAGSRKGASRYESVTDISNDLKSMALKLGVTVVALAQLNREADGQRPSPAHLKDSGSIEQDADIILMLHMPDEGERYESEITMELMIAKHRNGQSGITPLVFNKPTTHFTNPKTEIVP